MRGTGFFESDSPDSGVNEKSSKDNLGREDTCNGNLKYDLKTFIKKYIEFKTGENIKKFLNYDSKGNLKDNDNLKDKLKEILVKNDLVHEQGQVKDNLNNNNDLGNKDFTDLGDSFRGAMGRLIEEKNLKKK